MEWVYNAGEYPVSRVNGGDTLIRCCSVSVAGGIQPDIYSKLFSDPEATASGFDARFLVCKVPMRRVKLGAHLTDETIYKRTVEVVSKLRGLQPTNDDENNDTPIYQPQGYTVLPDSEEWKRLDAYHDLLDEARIQCEKNKQYAQYLGKMFGRMLRIATIFQSVADLTNTPHNLPLFTEETVQRAITLSRWYTREYARTYKWMAVQKASDDVKNRINKISTPIQKAVDLVRRNGGRLDHASLRGNRSLMATFDLAKTTGQLVCREEQNEGRGRPKKVWTLP